METWKLICAEQAARLKAAQELSRHAKALIRHGRVRAWVNPEDVKLLQETDQAIASKLERLEKGEFHIAVVGTEKAGKSSFINAWLESDLLPNKQARCTFTTTRLHSVGSEREQRLEVYPKTHAELQELEETLRTEAKSHDQTTARLAQDDLVLINENKAQLEQVIDAGMQRLPFVNLDEISDDLERYAATPSYAHAIKRVELYTARLASMDGILFYDVPGLNSGLIKHTRETKDMLYACDAVIVVKNITKPSFDGSEKEILHYVEEGDKSVKITDKVFFFISQIDRMNTRAGFLENKEEILRECERFSISKDKVFFGAATTVLHLQNRLKDTNYVMEKEKLKGLLQELLELPDTKNETVIAASGIRDIRARIDRYLETEREKILRESCDSVIRTVEECARKFQTAVARYVPENPDDVERKFQDQVNMKFMNWADQYWTKVTSDISDREGESQGLMQALAVVSNNYRQAVEEGISAIPSLQPEQRDLIMGREKAKHGTDEMAFNVAWRYELHKEVMDMVEALSKNISVDLYKELDAYMDTLSVHFNSCIDVKNTILEQMEIFDLPAYQAHLRSALKALFLRYSRPLAMGLIKYRHGTTDRANVCKEYVVDFSSLSNSFDNEETVATYGNLAKYIKSGVLGDSKAATQARAIGAEITKNAGKVIAMKAGKKVAGMAIGGVAGGPVGAAAGALAGEAIYEGVKDMLDSEKEESKDYVAQTIEEIEQDVTVLKEYLLNAVFQCTGITEFARQEFEGIITKFLHSHNSIKGLLLSCYQRREAKLMELLPPDLQQAECDTEISNLLHELTLALQQRR